MSDYHHTKITVDNVPVDLLLTEDEVKHQKNVVLIIIQSIFAVKIELKVIIIQP